MNRWARRLLALGAVVAVGGLLRATVLRPDPVPVTVHRVDKGRVEESVVNSRAGTVESRLHARMSPGIDGLVAAIPARKGAGVKKGDVLLRLDDVEHRARRNLTARSVEAARAVEREAQLSAEQADRDLRRVEGLAERGLASDQELDDARTAAQVTEAQSLAASSKTQEAEAALAAAEATLAKTVMVAPFDGVVLDVTTEVGEWISPSPPGVLIPPVVEVIDPAALYVTSPMDEADVALIRVGLPVRIALDAFPARSFAGSLVYVPAFVETRQEQNRVLVVEADFAERPLPENLLAGLSADIEVILDAREDVLRVPTYALLEGNRALVVRGNVLQAAEVEIGLRNWDFTEIRSGLAEGDLVVVSLDRPEVKEDARVEIAGGTER
jgi:HlyD family secretion protein